MRAPLLSRLLARTLESSQGQGRRSQACAGVATCPSRGLSACTLPGWSFRGGEGQSRSQSACWPLVVPCIPDIPVTLPPWRGEVWLTTRECICSPLYHRTVARLATCTPARAFSFSGAGDPVSWDLGRDARGSVLLLVCGPVSIYGSLKTCAPDFLTYLSSRFSHRTIDPLGHFTARWLPAADLPPPSVNRSLGPAPTIERSRAVLFLA